MADKKIEITIKGHKADKDDALFGLLSDANPVSLRKVMANLPKKKIIEIAQTVHGAMYRYIFAN